MEMFLMGLCVSVFGLAVAAVAFGAATRTEAPAPVVQPAIAAPKEVPARFFSDRPPLPVPVHPQIPIEVLLQQIENHVRLEQAVAESFLEFPTHAVLHSKTTSALVN